jgi:alkane 1-monooxygenase
MARNKLMHGLHDARLGFLLAYAIPAIVVCATHLGQLSGYPSAFAFLPLLVVYVFAPTINALWAHRTRLLSRATLASARWQSFYRVLPRMSLPAELIMLYVAADNWSSSALNGWGRLGCVLSAGVCGALFAINISHELMHRKQTVDRVLAGILLSTVGFGVFRIAHLRIHHRHVGTPLDPATARRGQSLYAFWCQSVAGNLRQALRCERRRLAKRNAGPWRSELVLWYGLSLLWLTLALGIWGWIGGIFFMLQCVLAILKLEWTNYLQHYGLARRRNAQGRYARIGPQHAWSQELFLTNLALLNLMRHADHHTHPQLPYQSLRHDARAPAYPYDITFMYLLALLTPLFRRIVHPHLDRFAAQSGQAAGA